jgi:hypothetical protein
MRSDAITALSFTLWCAGVWDHVVKAESSWNVMAHGDAWEGNWRGNWRMEWVARTLHTTSEHGVSSITTTNAHTSAASRRLNWRPPPISMDPSVSRKDEIWLLRVCHHISNAVYLYSAGTCCLQHISMKHCKKFTPLHAVTFQMPLVDHTWISPPHTHSWQYLMR